MREQYWVNVLRATAAERVALNMTGITGAQVSTLSKKKLGADNIAREKLRYSKFALDLPMLLAAQVHDELLRAMEPEPEGSQVQRQEADAQLPM